ncbi:MAG: hypothetical protein AB7U82_09660 [Blastocatellales bacterium]
MVILKSSLTIAGANGVIPVEKLSIPASPGSSRDNSAAGDSRHSDERGLTSEPEARPGLIA